MLLPLGAEGVVRGSSRLALANVVGSNIFNVLLVLGVVLLVGYALCVHTFAA